jgi:hypothetical protein
VAENVQNPGSEEFFALPKSGHFMCYRTGQINLLPTEIHTIPDTLAFMAGQRHNASAGYELGKRVHFGTAIGNLINSADFDCNLVTPNTAEFFRNKWLSL